MGTIFKPDKLEHLLVKSWHEFTDIRKLMEWCQSTARAQGINPTQCASLTLERFEWTPEGFVLWITYEVNSHDGIQRLTSEALLTDNGELTHIQTIMA